MNTHKKILLTFTLAFTAASQMHAANGNVTELDQAGINVIFELTDIYKSFVSAAKNQNLYFDFSRWTFLLNTNVKTYVEDYSKTLGIQDLVIKNKLTTLLKLNEKLMDAIKELKLITKPPKELDTIEKIDEYNRVQAERFLKPLEDIEQNIRSQMKNLEGPYYVLAKPKEMLFRVYNLMHLITKAMIEKAGSTLYMN